MSKPVFFQALKWSMAGELASKVIQPLVFIILARLLTPEDYGVVAVAIMVISFTQIFWEAGMNKALIQRQNSIEESADTAFWINVVLGGFISIALFCSADTIAMKIFQDDRGAAVLQVMTIQIFLGAFASVHTALLQKAMKFNLLFWVRVSTVAVPGLFSIPMALYGMSYWALVVGTLVGQLAQVILLWKFSDWRPRFRFNTIIAKQLGKFAYWVVISGLLAWFYLWVDSLFVGAYFGTHELGLYRTGNQFITLIYGFLFSPILPVLYSHFSILQHDKDYLGRNFFKVVGIMTLISIPLAFLLFAISTPLGSVTFGEQWKGIDLVIKVMALTHGFSWIVGANGEIYRAIGKPFYETIVNTPLLLIYLTGYYISAKYGLQTFLWTRYFLALFGVCLHLYFSWKAVRFPVFRLLRLIAMAAIIGSIAPLLSNFVIDFNNPYLQIVSLGSISVVLMGSLLFLYERNRLLKDVINLLKKTKTK